MKLKPKVGETWQFLAGNKNRYEILGIFFKDNGKFARLRNLDDDRINTQYPYSLFSSKEKDEPLWSRITNRPFKKGDRVVFHPGEKIASADRTATVCSDPKPLSDSDLTYFVPVFWDDIEGEGGAGANHFKLIDEEESKQDDVFETHREVIEI